MQKAGRRSRTWKERFNPPLVAKQHPAGIVFLFGREKSTPGTDFSDVLVEVAKTLAANLQRHDVAKLNALAAGGELKEICNAEEKP